MEIRLKLQEVLSINNALKMIIDDTQTKVDPLFKFRLLGIMKAIEPNIANFELIRNEKIAEYGEKKEDGSVQISMDNTEAVEKFSKDINKIVESEVVINIVKLKASDVFDKGARAEYLMVLYPIIEG